MTISINILQSQVMAALGGFLASVLPANVLVILGQTNRVPQPAGTDFVEMTPLTQERLAGNVDNLVNPSFFTGSITGTTLTITNVVTGSLAVGTYITGPNVLAGTQITALGSGTGGVGTYTVNSTQTAPSGPIQAATLTYQQYTQVVWQIDVHGPNSGDNAQIITTLRRDQYACSIFEAAGLDMDPLFASEPRQTPFIDGEQQYENRWSIDLTMEVNPIVSSTIQNAIGVGPVNLYFQL